MLIALKASLKKIAVYVIIMLVMIMGSAFMIYNNFIKGSAPASYSAEIPALSEFDGIPSQGGAVVPVESGAPAKTEKAEAIKNIGLTGDKRYKNLKEVISEPVEGKIGRDNPFASYTQ